MHWRAVPDGTQSGCILGEGWWIVLYKEDLHEYQNRGIDQFYDFNYRQGILPMGSGKTIMGLTAAKELIDAGEITCAIGFAPKRVAENVWPNEVSEWDHLGDMRVSVVSGSQKERLAALDVDADYYSIGLDNIQWMVDILKGLPKTHKFFGLINIDEISRFKNPASKRLKALFPLRKQFKIAWGLTGTPAPNGVQDQFGPTKFLSDGQLWGRSFWGWRAKNFYPTDYQQRNWAVFSDETEKKLWSDVSSMSFTVDPKELVKIPSRPLITWVDMPRKLVEPYRKMQRELIGMFKDGGVLAANKAVAQSKCEQMVQGFVYGNDGEVLEWLHAVKGDALLDMIEAANGEPVLVTYRFRADLMALQAMFPSLPYLGAGVDGAKADTFIRNWNNRQYPVMAVHPASAGHGLNLQRGGSQIIHYCLGWSAEEYDQVIARLARQGQTAQHVNNHHIMMRDTVDLMKFARVVKKMSMQQAFIDFMERI
jgi:SNF2 family DNA or RNA helicase